MPVLTRRLALVVAIASIAMVGARTWIGFAIVNAVVLVVAGVDWAMAPSPGRVGVERELPDVVALDTVASCAWQITNPARRKAAIEIADELAPSLRARARRLRVTVKGRGTVEARTAFKPARRGRFDISALAVRTFGPLGLLGRQSVRSLPDTLRVYPAFPSRDEAELRINRARIIEVGLRTAQGRGGGTEFDQLREYTPDDELKRMDWAATARAGKAIVRTYRPERNQTVISLLDNGRVMAARVDDVPKVEHAMDAVMALTMVATRLGDRAGLVTFDRRVQGVVPPGHGRAQLGRVTEAMYDLEPQLTEPDYLGAFTETLARFRRRAMLVLLTDLLEQAVQENLLPALPLLVRHHVMVVASVQDPAVVGWARGRPELDEDTYRKVAAIEALEERRRVTARLQGLGVTVIDSPPQQLGAQLADAYLRVKATGRL
jgi:uncharacterized protein (DUF58 family)